MLCRSRCLGLGRSRRGRQTFPTRSKIFDAKKETIASLDLDAKNNDERSSVPLPTDLTLSAVHLSSCWPERASDIRVCLRELTQPSMRCPFAPRDRYVSSTLLVPTFLHREERELKRNLHAGYSSPPLLSQRLPFHLDQNDQLAEMAPV